MRFNTPTQEATRTTNLAGGEAFRQSPKLEFASLLLTSFVQDQFYRKASESIDQLRSLLDSGVDPLFAARAAVFARNEYGMRSISHVVAGELAARVTAAPWLPRFLNRVVRRPDDVIEITAYYFGLREGQKETNAMRRGLGAALVRFDEYQLAKYRAEGKKYGLVDCVNLYHPKATPALGKLIRGELKSRDTWEKGLTQAGQSADTEQEKQKAKAEVWTDLLKRRKLGYMALLKNLRNILEQAPQALGMALEQLQNPEAIRKSLVLPFRFATAMDEVAEVPNSREVLAAISNATEISLASVPKFPGDTLVALDVSGSMAWECVGGNPNRSVIDLAALFAAVLYKANNADLLLFDTRARYLQLDPTSSLQSMNQQIRNAATGGGTDFRLIPAHARRAYDRIIILSDMQGWVGGAAPTREFAEYKQRHSCDPHIYSFDLQGYGSLQLPERQVYCLAGFSEKVFEVMKILEEDRNALVKRIEEVEI